ncbi:hypothetical protein JZ751_014260 [Albula glossodonta]|uniref:G-protein coupled receptors family 1 profile domain-containing protein n=1 Tax=Albula glossodonta TaxID=121402 RepID=A0A8T2NSU9_9TELE|nr:hypothetical protein JZ751_014260 [Albula glossodonta]
MNLSDSCAANDGTVPFTAAYIIIFLLGLVGSLTGLCAFTRNHREAPKSVYLINLLVSDLLLMVALPFKIVVSLGLASWNLQIFHCQVSAVLVYINLYVSLVFLALVSLDRYFQIAQSSRLRLPAQEAGLAKVMSVSVWALVLCIMVPNMAIPIQDGLEERPGRVSCADLKRTAGLHWHTLSSFLGGGIFLNASAAVLISNGLALRQLWSRRHHLLGKREDHVGAHHNARRAACHIATVTLAYVVCFVPYHTVRTPYTLAQNRVITDCLLKRRLYLAKESTLLLAVLHLCFNPILYFHLSSSFRQRVQEAFRAKGNTSTPTQNVELNCQEP